jgi:hypothetical protein
MTLMEIASTIYRGLGRDLATDHGRFSGNCRRGLCPRFYYRWMHDARATRDIRTGRFSSCALGWFGRSCCHHGQRERTEWCRLSCVGFGNILCRRRPRNDGGHRDDRNVLCVGDHEAGKPQHELTERPRVHAYAPLWPGLLGGIPDVRFEVFGVAWRNG